MIKGISKQIIEIKCTNNEYFEKALLFLNSNGCAISDDILDEYANDLTARLSCGETGAFGKYKRSSGEFMKKLTLYFVLTAAAAIVAGFVVLYF